MIISEDRMKHSLAVARKMRAFCANDPGKFGVDPDEAFVLGFLHDVGYEFVESQSDHANAGGLLLKDQGYKYWKEVFYHGIYQTEYKSPVLRLLNYIDMTTGPAGEDMTIQERIDDIKVRYGEDSIQVESVKELAAYITGFFE